MSNSLKLKVCLKVNVKIMMFIASVFGALTGTLFIAVVKPGYDFYEWLGLFAVIGIGVGNLALLVLYKLREWLKT